MTEENIVGPLHNPPTTILITKTNPTNPKVPRTVEIIRMAASGVEEDEKVEITEEDTAIEEEGRDRRKNKHGMTPGLTTMTI